MALFSVALVSGAGPLVSGAGKFLNSLTPGMAQASDQPAKVYGPAGDGVARLPMTQFAAASPYSPQVLFPVKSHIFPDWLMRAVHHAAPLPAQPVVRNPVIAICIDDLGEDLAGTDRAIALPKEVAMSFLPYAESTPFLAQEAQGKGHIVLAHVPMEALSHTNPGPMTLTVGAPDIARKIAWNIVHVPGLSGINNHEGSRFTQDAPSLAPVMRALAARGLDPALPVMRAHGVPGVVAYLRGEASLEAAIQKGKTDTRHYSKRQFTFIRHQLPEFVWAAPEAAEQAVFAMLGR